MPAVPNGSGDRPPDTPAIPLATHSQQDGSSAARPGGADDGVSTSAPAATDPATVPSGLAGKFVLLAEDSFLIARDLVDHLDGLGAIVVGPLASVDDAMRCLEARPPDAAIIDIDLQGEKAFPVADRLAALCVPFIFVTGYDRSIVPQRLGNVALLEKPCDVNSTVEALLNALSAAPPSSRH